MSTRAVLHSRLILLHLLGVLPKCKADALGARVDALPERTAIRMIGALDEAIGFRHGIRG